MFKDVGHRGGDTAPFGQVVALATPWRRGRRHKGSEAKLENFENRGGPIFFYNFQRSSPGQGAGGDMLGNFENGGHRLLNVFQNIAFGPLGVAAGLPMRSQSRLQRPRYMFDPSRWPLRGP